MPLRDDELRAVLTRAVEIEQASRPDMADLEAVIGAAEAAGYSRAAVERAIKERFGQTMAPTVGDMAFAMSTDGNYYPARVVAQSDVGVRVRFLKGTEHDVTPDQLRPFNLIPGERVFANWPMWGTWLCAVVSYDAPTGKVKLSDRWGSTWTFPVSEVWLERPSEKHSGANAGWMYTMVGAGFLAGGILGSLITALLMR